MSTTADNPFFKHADRAPYELAMLLRKLPDSMDSCSPLTNDQEQIAAATLTHIENARGVLLQGLEGIGDLLFTAGMNEDYPLEGGKLTSIGLLINHLAVELQGLHELDDSLTHTLRHSKGASR